MTSDHTNAWKPEYSRWRHGGWYVNNVRYPSGAVGCVSNNYPDKQWRIACEMGLHDLTFPNRDAAARAEYAMVHGMTRNSHGAVVDALQRLEAECRSLTEQSDANALDLLARERRGYTGSAAEQARAALKAAGVEP